MLIIFHLLGQMAYQMHQILVQTIMWKSWLRLWFIFFWFVFFCYCGQFRATKIVERGTVAMIYSEVESESFVIYCQGWKWEKEVLVWNVVSFPSHPSLPPFPFFIFFYLFFPPSPLCHCVLFCSGGFLPKCTWGAWGVLGFCAFLVEKKITLCIIAHFHALWSVLSPRHISLVFLRKEVAVNHSKP